MLVVEKFPGANTLEVTEGVEDALEKLRPGLAGLQTDTSVFRPATFIEDALGQPRRSRSLIGGALLAAGPRSRSCSTGARCSSPWSRSRSRWSPPRSCSTLLGETLQRDRRSPASPSAVAIVVDEAVAGADHVARRLREQREAGGAPAAAAIVRRRRRARSRAPARVRDAHRAARDRAGGRAWTAGPGAFFEPLALAYALAVLAAMLVALTVTPALSRAPVSPRGKPARRESPLLRRARAARYAGALAAVRAPAADGRSSPRAPCALVGLVTLPFLGIVAVPSLQGPRRAGPARRRARHLATRDDRDRDRA